MKAISCRIDDATMNALRLVAMTKGTTVGDLVSKAIESQYSAELDYFRDFFLIPAETKKILSGTK